VLFEETIKQFGPPKFLCWLRHWSGQCSLRKMYTKQMFVLVRMQFHNHVNT